MAVCLRVLCVLLTELFLSFAATSEDTTTSWMTEIPSTLAGMLNTETDTSSSSTEIEAASSEPTIDEDEEASRSYSIPKPAECEPELTTVNLRQTEELSLYYIPSCTRIPKCGGCCGNFANKKCQPVEVEPLLLKVAVKKYLGKRKWKNLPAVFVKEERHIKCSCGCIVKQSDCNPLQEYSSAECQCKCTNRDEKQKCDADKQTKRWDVNTCSCQCRNNVICASGFTFNNVTCSCEEERLSLRRGS